MNKVFLSGNVGQEPQITTVAGDKKVTKFSIAVNEYGGKNEKGERIQNTTWFNVVAWNQLAETISSYVKKGQKIIIEGRITIREYEKDQVKHKVTEIIAENFEFFSSKSDETGTTNVSPAKTPSKKKEEASVAIPSGDIPEMGSDDLPF